MSKQPFDPTKVQGLGLEDLETSNSLPILRILQKGSAEVDESHELHEAKKIDGAKAGNIVFAPTSELFKKVSIIPLAQRSIYTRWKPKNQGGGFLSYEPLNIVNHPKYRKGDKNKEFLDTDELVYTIYVAVLFYSEENKEWTRALIPFTSTNLGVVRTWNKQLRGFKYPETEEFKDIQPFLFSQQWCLATEARKNNEGSWFAFHITPEKVFSFTDDAETLAMANEAAGDATADLPAPAAQQMLEEDQPF
jgi:hypothetical protein